MQVNISGVHLEVTDALRDYIEEKFDRLARHFDRIISVQVVLQVEKLKQKAEATLHVAGREVVGNAEHEDMYAAVDLLVDKLDRQVCRHKDKVQDVKKLVSKLDAQERSETKNHCAVYRPWGWYETLTLGDRFQVKRICVNPGAALSLQMHHHRAEHWIVVSGTAQVTCNDKTFLLTENQSTYIPITSVHRLANPGKIPLEIIEVQSGSYLGEDDIERFDDVYGRAEQSNEAKVAR